MSSGGDFRITVAEYASINVNLYFSLISITILIYEYCITFPLEVARFWEPQVINWASFFFYLNRYLTLLGHIPVMLEYFWTSSNPVKLPICKRLQSYHQYLAIVIQVVVASMLIMRTYALYKQSRRVLAMFVFISVAVVACGCWAVIGKNEKQAESAVLVFIGCGVSLTNTAAMRIAFAWIGMLVFDLMVFSMTLYKSLTLPRSRGVNLLMILLRDGSIYFGVMMASNLANILTFVYGGLYTRGVVTMFTNIMSSILISRLMLNLRDPALTPISNHNTDTTTMRYGYPNFSTVINLYQTNDSEGGVMTSDAHREAEYGDYSYSQRSMTNDTDTREIELVSIEHDTRSSV